MRIIKKYGNRRLYDTEASAYINLDELAALIRQGEEVQVVDAKLGEDLTREVLLQVIIEGQALREVLPVGLLRRMIRYSGENPYQRVAMQQIGAALSMLDAQVAQVERQFNFQMPPFPGAPPPPPRPAAAEERPPEDDETDGPDEQMDALRARLKDLEGRLKR